MAVYIRLQFIKKCPAFKHYFNSNPPESSFRGVAVGLLNFSIRLLAFLVHIWNEEALIPIVCTLVEVRAGVRRSKPINGEEGIVYHFVFWALL